MMFYHFVLHCTFKSEAPLTGAAAIHHQHGVAQGRQSAQPQVLHPFVGVVHQLNLQGNKRSSGLTHFNNTGNLHADHLHVGTLKICSFLFLLVK